MSAASLLSSFGIIDIEGKVLGGIWEGKSGIFMALDGKLFSVAEVTVWNSKEVLIWKLSKGAIKSDEEEMRVYINSECPCWEE